MNFRGVCDATTDMGLHNRDYMRAGDDWRGSRAWTPQWSPTAAIIGVCVGAFIFQIVLAVTQGSGWKDLPHPGDLSFAALTSGDWWRLVTFNFLHGGILHFVSNMVFLWVLGSLARDAVKAGHVAAIFLLGGVVGGLVNCLVYRDAPLVGASAGAFALLVALAAHMPHRQVTIPFLPGFPVSLKYIGACVLMVQIVTALAQGLEAARPETGVVSHEKVATLSHLGGAVVGFIYGRFALGGFGALVRESERRERALREERLRRREPSRVAAGRQPLALPEPHEPPALADYLQEVVDPILEKMHAHGAQSLSAEERRVLGEAADRLKKGGGRG